MFPLVWEASGGVPRLINLICDTALVYGYAEQLTTIGSRIVRQVIRDKEVSFAPVGAPFRSRDEVVDGVGTEANSAASPRLRRSTIERAVLSIKKGNE